MGGGGGLDGLSEDKANLSPAKLKLADIGLELSLAIGVDCKTMICTQIAKNRKHD